MNMIGTRRTSVVCVIGTRPEAIKFAPVLRAFASRADQFIARTLITSQHTDLLEPFLGDKGIPVDAKAAIRRDTGGLNEFLSEAVRTIDDAYDRLRPDLVLVQGDTTSTLAGAMAAFNRGIRIGHVEAGLRSGDRRDPFPEEMNRRLVTRLADLHFTATGRNTGTLRAEGVDPASIIETGNTVVDELHHALATTRPSPATAALIGRLEGRKILAVTCHRRENHGARIGAMLGALRDFTLAHDDVVLVFPVHPNPAVGAACAEVFPDHERINLIAPLDYGDFVHLMRASWLIASDSGGVQEEAPSLGKGLLVLRETTERPEVIESGHARLCGTDAGHLRALLEECHAPGSWITRLEARENPFGRGDAARRIVAAVEALFAAPALVDA